MFINLSSIVLNFIRLITVLLILFDGKRDNYRVATLFYRAPTNCAVIYICINKGLLHSKWRIFPPRGEQHWPPIDCAITYICFYLGLLHIKWRMFSPLGEQHRAPTDCARIRYGSNQVHYGKLYSRMASKPLDFNRFLAVLKNH